MDESDIKIRSEDDYIGKVAKSLPFLGGAVSAVDGATGDGEIATSDIKGFLTDSASFVASCTESITGYVADPIGWLTSQGLSFLITLIQPLQDCLHAVSGDGPALANAAGNFANIGKGMQGLAEEISVEAGQKLDRWKGEAATLAHGRLDQFARGVQGVAAEAGNISQLLQASSMFMTVIEDLIKSLITEFVTWLLWIWIPALAMSAMSFGASVLDAMGLSVAKGTKVVTEATGHVSKLQNLLNKLRTLMGKIKKFLADHEGKLRGSAMDLANPNRSNRGFAMSMVQAGTDSLAGQVIPSDKSRLPGGITSKQIGNAGKVGKVVDSGTIGEGQDTEQTSEDLEF